MSQVNVNKMFVFLTSYLLFVTKYKANEVMIKKSFYRLTVRALHKIQTNKNAFR